MKLGKLPELIFTLILAVVMIQLAIGAIQPYLGWIGRTFAIVIIVVMVAAMVATVIALVRFLLKHFRDGGTWNG